MKQLGLIATFVFRKTDEPSMLKIGTEVFVDVVENEDGSTGPKFLSTLSCIGPRPLQVTIDRYVSLLKMVTPGSVVEYFYDDKSVAVGGILKINTPLDSKKQFRILFDRSVAYFCGISLEKANVELFFRSSSVRCTFDDQSPLDTDSPLVARAKNALTGIRSDTLTFFVASYVFVGPHISDILKRKPVNAFL